MRAPARLTLALTLLLAGCGGAPATAVAENAAVPAESPTAFPELTGRVVDRADLLTPAQQAALAAESEALEQRTGDQLVIVTVPSLGGRTIEEFGLALGNRWGIGQADRDNGVLIILAPAERQVRIEVGYGLEPILTDARAREIIERDLLPPLRERRWHDALQAGTRSVVTSLIDRADEPRRGRP